MANRQLASASIHLRPTSGCTMEVLDAVGSTVLITDVCPKQTGASETREKFLTDMIFSDQKGSKESKEVPLTCYPCYWAANQVIGVPRKVPPCSSTCLSPTVPSRGGLEHVDSSSSEEEEEDDGEEGEEEDGEEEETPEQILLAAGVDIANLEGLQCDERHCAPMELLTEFLGCVMREKYEAAKVLCEKVLQLEPTNQYAVQFLPVIMERLQINAQFSSEESDSTCSDETSDGDDHTSSEESDHAHGDDHTLQPTCRHPHNC